MAAADNQYEHSLWHYTAPPQMEPAQLARWIDLLAQRTGISWPEKRKSFLLTSISSRMRELGFSDYETYFLYLNKGSQGAVEWEILVDRLTVHESRFYRDPRALELIREVFLTSHFSESGVESDAGRPRVDMWSIGCSTGEEPYSLAMLIDDYLIRRGMNAYYSITASDISAASLSSARSAIYHNNKLKNLPDDYIRRYFLQHDDHHYAVKQNIKDRICFTRLNLMHLPKIKVGMMDLIYCQNVLIYFKRQDRYQILNNMVEHLRPGGLLILGAAEINDWKHEEMQSVSYQGTLAFRRTCAAGECQS